MPRPNSPQMGVPEKSKNFLGSIKRLFKNLKAWQIILAISFLLAMASSILSLISPNKLSDLTDTITSGIKPNITEEKVKEIMLDEHISKEDKILFSTAISTINKDTSVSEALDIINSLPTDIYEKIKPSIDLNKIKDIALLLTCLYLISTIFNFTQSFLMTGVSNNFARQLRTNISKKINRLPLKYFDSHETGDILSRITNDVDTIAQNLNNSLATLVSSITLFIGSIIMMFATNWIMAITAIIASLIGFIFMAGILNKSQKYFTEKQQELGDLNGYIEEIYSGHNVVKAYNGEIKAINDFNNLNSKLYGCSQKSQFLSSLMPPIMSFVGNFGYVAVCIVGALLVSNNTISFGVIVAFMIYVRLFTNPLTQIAQAMASLQATAAASERVYEFLDEKELRVETNLTEHLDKNQIEGNIEFKNVKFGYNPNTLVIKNFNVKIKAGEKVAIVGPTGAGKTTLVNLLMKFYEINDGNIFIDGISTKKLTRENIHDLFVMVLQDTWLFEGTVAENIIFNKENVNNSEVWKACKTVGVDHFIKTLSGGLNSTINNDDSVSQGQKQLLTIARGMIKNSPLLILDEATSNVDTRTEELVQKAMDELTKGRTSFIIAHRLSTIKNADLILVMNNGDIIEQGNHTELMAKNGFYADLYNSQFRK